MDTELRKWQRSTTGVYRHQWLPEAFLIDHDKIPRQSLSLFPKRLMLMCNLGARQSFCLEASKKRMRQLLPPQKMASAANPLTEMVFDLLAHPVLPVRGETFAMTVLCHKARGLGRKSGERLASAIEKRIVDSFEAWRARQPDAADLPSMLDSVLCVCARPERGACTNAWLAAGDLGFLPPGVSAP